MATTRKSLKVSEASYAGYVKYADMLGVPIAALTEAIGLHLHTEAATEEGDPGVITEFRAAARERLAELARQIAKDRRQR